MDLQFCIFIALFVALQIWLLPVLTHWISSAVDEGYTSYSAQRIRAGEWPYRDFFFLWTPGTPYFHAFLQIIGFQWLGERGAALAASALSFVLVDFYSRAWFHSRLDLWLARFSMAAFSFSLWNIPYSSWYAVLFALLAIRLLPKSAIASGALFALSFWFKQNVGILACLGAGAFLFYAHERKKLLKLLSVFFAALFIPFVLLGILGGKLALTQAFSQIFLFPIRYPALMGSVPAAADIAAPLTSVGLWILSLFFLRANAESKSAVLLRMGVLAYVTVYVFRSPWNFIQASLILVSFLAWPLALMAELAEKVNPRRRQFLMLWLPGLGMFAQVFPRLDFQHFLFVFPLSAFFLIHALSRISARYPALPRMWVRLPACLLLLAGLTVQWWVIQIRLEGSVDSMGRISRGVDQRLNEEVIAVWRYLKTEGLNPGDPILVLPNATSVYQWTGFRNITPHQQFFPGYVEAFGARSSEVLANYRKQGGKYLVVQERSDLEINVPEIAAEIQRDYEPVKSFPENFTIYVPRK